LITLRDFKNGLTDFGVQIDESDVKSLFNYLDKNKTGKVDLGELLDELRG
jgi:Ca2+-binding EF-hand superfamily protein